MVNTYSFNADYSVAADSFCRSIISSGICLSYGVKNEVYAEKNQNFPTENQSDHIISAYMVGTWYFRYFPG